MQEEGGGEEAKPRAQAGVNVGHGLDDLDFGRHAPPAWRTGERGRLL